MNLYPLLLEAIGEFQLAPERIHMVLRDAVPNIGLTTRLMKCVKHGLSMLLEFGSTLENVKKLIRKVRKSSISREYLKELQSLLDLTQHVLIKATEVRWDSTYSMLECFRADKAALSMFSAEVKGSPSFTAMQWELTRKLFDMLKSIYTVTIELQSRRASIVFVVPIFRSLILFCESQDFLSANCV